MIYSNFTLTIELGNDAMQSPRDVAAALEQLAKVIRARAKHDRGERSRLDDSGEGSIMDANGNTVGRWSFG